MKKILVIGNWKMYVGTRDGASMLARDIKKLAAKYAWSDMYAAPAFPHIVPVATALKRTKIRVGAQALAAHENGAHTGEVSAGMLKDAGATFCIVGHSERRALGEHDAMIREQVQSALKRGLRVVLCVGERERDTEHGTHFEYVNVQMRAALAGIAPKDAGKIVIAYEPVWAIGKKGEEAVPPKVLRETVIFIRKSLVELFDRTAALKIPIVYGGSVDEFNIEALFLDGGVQGFLVGRGSVDPVKFGELLAALHRAQGVMNAKKK